MFIGKDALMEEKGYAYGVHLARMIACPTISVKGSYDDSAFAQLRRVMAEEFPLVHQRCEKMTFGEDCWVFRLPGRDPDRNVMLMSHHDVVAAEGDWEHPPFGGEIAEGKIWGRGTVDTKTPLFAEFAALEELLAEGYQPECNIYLASSHNEEIAGNGIPLANAYFKERGIRFELVLDEGGGVIDPPVGGLKCEKCAMVAIHEKGRHKLLLTATDETGHGSLAAGKHASAVERIAAFVTDVGEKPGFIRRLNPQLRLMLETLAPHASLPLKLVFRNLWCFGPVLTALLPKLSPQAGGLLGTTCGFREINTTRAGRECTATAMLRSVNDRDFERDYAAFVRRAEKYGITVRKTDDWEYHAPADPTLPPFGLVSDCVARVFPGVPVVPFILPAGTDARTLTDVCPCVLRFAPIRLSKQQLASVHSENENIDLSAVADCVRFYRMILTQYSIREEAK